MFGMSREQTDEASTVMRAIGEEWRALVAGREGFLVGRKRAGLLRQAVVWGEMDRMVCCALSCDVWSLEEEGAFWFRGQWLIINEISRNMSTMLCMYDMRNLRG